MNNCSSFLEQSTVGTVCFYHLPAGSAAEEQLRQRLSHSQVGLLVLNRGPKDILDVPHFITGEDNWMKSQERICDHFYPLNWENKDKKIIGVTGTNGKTTTVHLTLQILQQRGVRGFTIGSLGVCDVRRTLDDAESIMGMTTPPYVELRKILFKYFKDYEVCVMEVSSHALAQARIYHITYDAAGWTSFGQDHLDYHKSLDNYFQQKLKLPQYHMKPGKHLLVSAKADDLLEKLYQASVPVVLTDELECFTQAKSGPLTRGADDVRPLDISFNRENLKMAAALVKNAYEYQGAMAIDMSKIVYPAGRFEILQQEGRLAIVDFAHTPDAMENVLQAIRENFPERKIITVFGCGGDRDREKRPVMGQISENKSDITIVTSDNPRSEIPENIIDEITAGMIRPDFQESNRAKAIALGVSLLTDQHVLVILGKGVEQYQIIGSEKRPFSDREEFYRCIQNIRRGENDWPESSLH